MYIYQMQGGTWQVDANTSAGPSRRQLCAHTQGFSTRAEAEAWRDEAERKARVMDDNAKRVDHGADMAAADRWGV